MSQEVADSIGEAFGSEAEGTETIASAILNAFESSGPNGESMACCIDGLHDALSNIATAITATAAPTTDASGGTVTSLTEAVMGITAGLFRIADAIENHAMAQYSKRIADEFNED